MSNKRKAKTELPFAHDKKAKLLLADPPHVLFVMARLQHARDLVWLIWQYAGSFHDQVQQLSLGTELETANISHTDNVIVDGEEVFVQNSMDSDVACFDVSSGKFLRGLITMQGYGKIRISDKKIYRLGTWIKGLQLLSFSTQDFKRLDHAVIPFDVDKFSTTWSKNEFAVVDNSLLLILCDVSNANYNHLFIWNLLSHQITQQHYRPYNAAQINQQGVVKLKMLGQERSTDNNYALYIDYKVKAMDKIKQPHECFHNGQGELWTNVHTTEEYIPHVNSFLRYGDQMITSTFHGALCCTDKNQGTTRWLTNDLRLRIIQLFRWNAQQARPEICVSSANRIAWYG